MRVRHLCGIAIDHKLTCFRLAKDVKIPCASFSLIWNPVETKRLKLNFYKWCPNYYFKLVLNFVNSPRKVICGILTIDILTRKTAETAEKPARQ